MRAMKQKTNKALGYQFNESQLTAANRQFMRRAQSSPWPSANCSLRSQLHKSPGRWWKLHLTFSTKKTARRVR